MITNNYDSPKGKYKSLPTDVKEILEKEFASIIDEIEYGNCEVRFVKSPFSIGDNTFDLSEANNTMEVINAVQTQSTCFTGGSCIMVYEVVDKSKPSIILHGNDEEGFNIFMLN
jgi:hypothetical protein